jgi:hypothetical protein
MHARWHDVVMKPWLRQGIRLAVALIVPVLLSLALLPLRGHVSDVLIALVLLTVSAVAVARGELLLSTRRHPRWTSSSKGPMAR